MQLLKQKSFVSDDHRQIHKTEVCFLKSYIEKQNKQRFSKEVAENVIVVRREYISFIQRAFPDSGRERNGDKFRMTERAQGSSCEKQSVSGKFRCP